MRKTHGIGRFMAKHWYRYFGKTLPSGQDWAYCETWQGSRALLNYLEGDAPADRGSETSQGAAEHFFLKLERAWPLWRARCLKLRREVRGLPVIPAFERVQKTGRRTEGPEAFQFECCESMKIIRFVWGRLAKYSRDYVQARRRASVQDPDADVVGDWVSDADEDWESCEDDEGNEA